jgi:small conductance mechanosensitive channel
LRALLIAALAMVAAASWGPSAAGQGVPSGAPAAAPAGDHQASPGGGEEPVVPQLSELVQGSPLEAATWRKLGDRLAGKLVDFLPNLLYALVLLVVFFLLYRLSARVLEGLLRRTGADPALRHIGLRLLRYVLLGLGLIAAAGQLGFQVGSLLAGLGVAGLAVGLAAQDTLANFIAGLTILWDRPFRIGDNVTIAGTFGRVMEIGLRSTRICTVEQLDAILPNKDVIDQEIINHTLNPRLRLGIPLGIAYKEDSREARRVLLAAVAGHPLVTEDPAPEVVVTALADSSVNLELRVWLKDPHEERRAACELLELAKIALDEAGIEIPFPQRTLHLGDGRLGAALERRLAGGGGGEGEG